MSEFESQTFLFVFGKKSKIFQFFNYDASPKPLLGKAVCFTLVDKISSQIILHRPQPKLTFGEVTYYPNSSQAKQCFLGLDVSIVQSSQLVFNTLYTEENNAVHLSNSLARAQSILPRFTYGQ